jgi:hypothetical protein
VGWRDVPIHTRDVNLCTAEAALARFLKRASSDDQEPIEDEHRLAA